MLPPLRERYDAAATPLRHILMLSLMPC